MRSHGKRKNWVVLYREAGVRKYYTVGLHSKMSKSQAQEKQAGFMKEVNARADKLGHRAEALCPRMQALDDLQKHFSFRLSDGSSLKLVSPDPDHHVKVVASF